MPYVIQSPVYQDSPAETNVKPENLVGTQLSHYRLEALIGTGGVAAVYRALDTLTQERVAIKVLFPSPGAGPTLTERFRREAHTAARLEHPGILRVFEVGEAGGYLFIAMELVEGPALQGLLEARGCLDEATAAEIGAQVADALHYAHTRGVIHRDVKPSNILFDFQGHALLTDFGVARALDAPALTTTGLTVGTPAYMSPEQASGRADLDGRADLYSLGVVLYQMVAGRTPFRGSTPQVLHAHVYEPPPPPSSVAHVSPPMEAVILRALAKHPEDRHPTGAALAADLWPLVEGTRTRQPAVLPHAESARSRPSHQPGTWRALDTRLLGVLAALLAAVVVGGGVWLAVGRPTPALLSALSGGAPVAVMSPVTAMPSLTSPSLPSPSLTLAGTAPRANGTAPAPQVSPSTDVVEAAPGDSTVPAALNATLTPPVSPASSLSSTPPPPTSTLSATPTACPQSAGTVFAGWLASDASLAAQVGCPRSQAIEAVGAWEPFEGGQMLWRGDLRRIYVLLGAGTWMVYDDEWREGDVEWDGSIVPPAGLHQPVRGFGLLWRDEPGVQVALGWATATEASFSGTFQPFERGLLIADGATMRLWALLSDGTWLAGP